MSNIIITGANQGIGYFMVQQFLEKGHTVAVLDLEIINLTKLKEKFSSHLFPFICDVRHTAEVLTQIGYIADQFTTIDIVIHNACFCTFSSMEKASEEEYTDVLNVNYLGAVRLTKAVVPYMKKQGKGKIIFTSSGVGVTGFVNISPYASSKGAIEIFAKCMNIEYQNQGISFHLFHPPLTRTKSSEQLTVPDEFWADARIVGKGLADHVASKDFVICHNVFQKLQIKLCYLFPLMFGKFMSNHMPS